MVATFQVASWIIISMSLKKQSSYTAFSNLDLDNCNVRCCIFPKNIRPFLSAHLKSYFQLCLRWGYSSFFTGAESCCLHGVKSLVVWSEPTLTMNSPSGSQLRSCTALKCPDITTPGLHSPWTHRVTVVSSYEFTNLHWVKNINVGGDVAINNNDNNMFIHSIHSVPTKSVHLYMESEKNDWPCWYDMDCGIMVGSIWSIWCLKSLN